MIVLDTNVLSELFRPMPDAGVMAWFGDHPSSALFTTAITQAEIFYGVGLMPDSKKRQQLTAIAAAIFDQDMAGRVLPFDSDAARAYAVIAAERRLNGCPISQFDAQIAAVCRSRGARLATRNIADFRNSGLELIDPWQ